MMSALGTSPNEENTETIQDIPNTQNIQNTHLLSLTYPKYMPFCHFSIFGSTFAMNKN